MTLCFYNNVLQCMFLMHVWPLLNIMNERGNNKPSIPPFFKEK